MIIVSFFVDFNFSNIDILVYTYLNTCFNDIYAHYNAWLKIHVQRYTGMFISNIYYE